MSNSDADISNCFVSLNTEFRARHLMAIHFKNVGYLRQNKNDCVPTTFFQISLFLNEMYLKV